MKKLLYIIIGCLLLSVNVLAQNSITLATTHGGGNVTAGESITLSPGFSFVSAAGKSMNLAVDITKYDIPTATVNDPTKGKPQSFSKDQNYVLTRTYMQEDGGRYLDQVQYFDGLGRPLQTVQRGITNNGNDLISIQEYDGFGRDAESWLPVVPATDNYGKFVSPTTVKTLAENAANYGSGEKPFSKPVYEPSPLNRVTEQYSPGASWHQDYSKAKGKALRVEYLTNTQIGETACTLYKVTGSDNNIVLTKTGLYANGQLFVTKTTSEDESVSYEFKDKLGQVVLTRQIARTSHDTYYVYDDFGNICFVLPPRIVDEGIAQDKLNQLAYLYKYDKRNRCTQKKLPGVDWIHYVYDKADRLIFSQDGEQRGKNEWTFMIPDALGRIVLTGVCKTANNANITVGRFDDWIIKAEYPSAGNGGHLGYNVNAGQTTFNPLALGNIVYYSANYYDNYTFLNKNSFPNYICDRSKEGLGYGKWYAVTAGYEAKGLLTGTMMAQFNSDGTTGRLYSAMYYDNRARLIQVQSTNHLGGKETEYVAYNFTGQPTKKMHVHTGYGKTITELYAYEYDHAGRLLKTKHKTDNTPELILAENTYDDLGRLQSNKKGNVAKLNTQYTYNIRSWTTSISSPMFTQKLHYNTSFVNNTPRFGGDITAMSWKVGTEAERTYSFKYDELSRLTHAAYNGVASGGVYNTSYTYDKHGNIQNLVRNGKKDDLSTTGQLDNLTMTYVGNQLTRVVDGGVKVNNTLSADFKDYTGGKGVNTYNKNGALASDSHKGVSKIQYNSLNLPMSIAIDNSQNRGNIQYVYSAGGAKLRATHNVDMLMSRSPVVGADTYAAASTTVTKTDYVGNKVYENEKLKRILVDGGYIENNKYYFYQTDHLGNNRVVTNNGGGLVQSTHYYPFGMAFAEKGDSEKQPYKYNGKELDERLGLNTYDYSARYMDPAIGRFTSVDPLAEKYYSISPYAYVANNPLKYIDPTGMWIGDYYDKYTGEHVYNDGIDDNKVYVRDIKNHFTAGGMFGGSVAVTTTTDKELKVGKTQMPDKTAEFNAQLEKTNDFFSSKRDEVPFKDKLSFFEEQVTNNSPFDIKRQDGPFHEDISANWGDNHGFFNGKLLRSDDFGNFNFGVAAKAFGIPEVLGMAGAGYVQIKDSFRKNSPVGGALSYWDDYKDNSMIKQGYKYYNQNFKK